jgi:hypothetical protein
MRTEDDEWFDKVEKLRERLEGDDPDEHIRGIARQEADKRLNAYLGPILFIAALWWANREQGSEGFWIVVALGVAWLIWTTFRRDWDPAHERHLIVNQAEDMNRLAMVAEAHEAGEQVWFVKEREFERDKRKISVFDNNRWDGSWQRIHGWTLEFERLSPRKRRKRLMQAAKRAKAALEQGEAIAKRENAELVFWARDFVYKLKRA